MNWSYQFLLDNCQFGGSVVHSGWIPQIMMVSMCIISCRKRGRSVLRLSLRSRGAWRRAGFPGLYPLGGLHISFETTNLEILRVSLLKFWLVHA